MMGRAACIWTAAAAIAIGCGGKTGGTSSSGIADETPSSSAGAGGTTSSNDGGFGEATSTTGRSGDPRGDGSGGLIGAGGASENDPSDESSNTCLGLSAGPELLPLDLHVLLDRSATMNEPLSADPESGSKWDNIVAALEAFARSREAAALGMGIQYFGQPAACDPQAYAEPAVPMGTLPEVADALVRSMAAQTPGGSRPTYPALQGALEYMADWQDGHPIRRSVVLLITDGLPNQCGASTTGCPDCSTSIEALSSLTRRFAEETPPVESYVMSLGSATTLGELAHVGSAEQAFALEAGDLRTQFREAIERILVPPLRSCTIDIPDPPEGRELDPNDVSITVHSPFGDGGNVPKMSVEDDCAINNGAGWYYDSPMDPKVIHLCPESCADAGGSITVEFGCLPLPE